MDEGTAATSYRCSTVDLFLRAAAEEAEVARHVVTKESLIPQAFLPQTTDHSH
ncbi:hypothetical protein [Amycolatopsis dongchuanensis]|uniref:hypothetical protein n=1 Tax=Amycolatopsis dongchuanensis TaxID=1070866 RepID=UPI0031F848AB